jgi:hypothetical protein
MTEIITALSKILTILTTANPMVLNTVIALVAMWLMSRKN